MNPGEYRAIVGRQQGRRPPCLKCRDKAVLFCMKTGFECREFSSFAAEHRTKKTQRCVSGGHGISGHMRHVKPEVRKEQGVLEIRISFFINRSCAHMSK